MLKSIRRHRRKDNSTTTITSSSTFCCLAYFLLILIQNVCSDSDVWPLDRPSGMPSIQSLDVMCGKDHMDVHLTFSQPFEGIVSSKGQHGDPRCVYVPPSTGQTFFSFRIAYARCGTKPDLHGQFYENTVVVQYDKDLLEVWDEAKRLRCEWFNDYEKTATKPPMVIADLDVIQLDFRGDNVDCWMEIQHGKGPWAPPVTGIVPLGSTLTLVVAINDYRGEFDMRVKSCVASDGGGHIIQLSDEFGCVLRPKMISKFLKARGADERASVITYAFFHAFKFPDALSVHIKCKVEICRHGCLDHCQQTPEEPNQNNEFGHLSIDRTDEGVLDEDLIGNHENHENVEKENNILFDDPVKMQLKSNNNKGDENLENEQEQQFGNKQEQQQQQGEEQMQQSSSSSSSSSYLEQVVVSDDLDEKSQELEITAVPHKDLLQSMQDKFPHGPRSFEFPEPSPRSFPSKEESSGSQKSNVQDTNRSISEKVEKSPDQPAKYNMKRRKRSVVISDRKVRSADVGVSGLYDVISEADLAFSPDGKAEAVTVFQGRIREEVVYGICMPVPGFSVLFVLVAVSAVVSALVAGSLLYRYQLQKEHLAEEAHHRSISLSLFSNWIGHRIWGGFGGGTAAVVRNNQQPACTIELRDNNGSMNNSLVLAQSSQTKNEPSSMD